MELSIAAIIIAVAGVLFTYFRFVLRTEHRLTKIEGRAPENLGDRLARLEEHIPENLGDRLTRLETRLEFVPYDTLIEVFRELMKRIPPASSNPGGARRAELMQRLERRELTYPEARELQELVKRDVERSSEDEVVKALILVGLGILIGYGLSELLK